MTRDQWVSDLAERLIAWDEAKRAYDAMDRKRDEVRQACRELDDAECEAHRAYRELREEFEQWLLTEAGR